LRTWFILSLLACGLFACGAALPKGPTTPPRADTGWKSMRAEHRVALDVTRADGSHDLRKLRGALAAERNLPGLCKFRLRALGPGGITLFDLLYVDGRVKVMEAIKDPKASALGAVIESLAGDLSAALLCGERATRIEGDALSVSDPDRTVRLSKFIQVSGHSVPTRIDIDNRKLHYRVGVDVSELEIDVPLDPALFAE
jgi:hypothetical protein